MVLCPLQIETLEDVVTTGPDTKMVFDDEHPP